MRKFVLFFLFFEVFNFKVFPAPVELTDSEGRYSLGTSLEILEDKTGILTLEEVLKSRNFRPSEKQIPNFGFTKSVFWVRFQVLNQSEHSRWLLHIAYPLLDKIEFYSQKRNGNWTKKITGDIFPFHNRAISHKDFLFRINIQQEKKASYYLRFQSEGTLQFPLYIYDYENFLIRERKEELVLGLYYGILIVLSIYNLILFFMIRDAGYLYYLLYITGYGTTQLILNGLAFEYLWPDSPWWANHSLPFVGGWAFLWGLQFTRNFLNTKSNNVNTDRILRFTMLLMSFLLVSSLTMSYHFNIYFLATLVILFAIIVLIAGTASLRSGYKPARYFLIAWISLLFGVGTYSLKGLGFIPANFFTEYGLQIGSAVEMCLLSLGLADRFNHLNLEREEANKRALEFEYLMKTAKLTSARLEIELLKNNIHPHFLLNSINATLVWLTEDPKTAGKLLEALAEELRLILELSGKTIIPVEKEIQLCKRYLEIMGFRGDKKFDFEWSGISGNEEIPPVILLTLVENGVTHGYSNRNSGKFTLRKDGNERWMRYTLFNDGTPEDSYKGKTTGTGIKYVKSRLEEAYPGCWEMDFGPAKEGFEIKITIYS